MNSTNSQIPTKVIRKDFFRGALFLSGLIIDLLIGSVGLFWLVQEVVFGLVYQGIPLFDWQIYLVLGVQNVPFILVGIYLLFLFVGIGIYAAIWRRMLNHIDQASSFTLGFVSVIFTSSAIVFSLVPTGLLQLYRIWLIGITGTPSKLLAIFVAIPATALSFGALLGRTGMVYRWSSDKRLMVETVQGKYGFVTSRRLFAVPK
jgi:hypothetical protein